MMISVKDNKVPHSWWFDGHGTPKRSMWLQSTLSELDEKTKAMLKLIETDADSFAQRAEMYYKKRPELISMVEEFYRTHRSLAERFDTLKSEPRTRLLQSLGFPSSAKCQLNKSNVPMEKAYDTYSETYSQYAESEVDDPEHDEETPDRTARIDEEESEESEIDDPEPEDASVDGVGKEDVSKVFESEIAKLKNEIERLKEENKIQKELLLQKDEEKREVIRQLSSSLEILKVKASPYKRSRGRESSKTWGPFEFDKVKGLLSVKLFG